MTKQRVAIFIDGSNFYHSTKRILRSNEQINHQKFIQELTGNRTLAQAFYYVAPLDPTINRATYRKHQQFLRMLRSIPKLKVVLCTLRILGNKKGSHSFTVKGDDVRLAHDLLMGAVDDLYDTAIIVSGDEDFLPVIGTIRSRYSKRVENVYFRSSSSYKLRRASDSSLNMSKIISKVVEPRNLHKSSSSGLSPH